jgi:hypothetical protein
MAKAKGQEQIDKLVETLRKWQKIERQTIENTAEIMEKTSNKLIWQIMEIIRNDSVQHHRVQQFIIDSLTTSPVHLTPDELGEVWKEIEEHDQVEREVVEMAKQLRDECPLIVQKQLIDYLIIDEEKHDKILTQLNEFKKKVSGPA